VLPAEAGKSHMQLAAAAARWGLWVFLCIRCGVEEDVKSSFKGLCGLILAVLFALPAEPVAAGFATTVPVSAETATSIARSFFPVTLALGNEKLFLTEPQVIYVDDRRLALEFRLQAYDHRPEQGIAISETGRARVSGEMGYDPKTRQVLLYEPRMDQLVFDEHNETTRRLQAEVQGAWRQQVGNPIRADLPPHPFIAPFREGIQDIAYQKRNIFIMVWYP
jgi:hypothetical protein